jgi:serine/threonine protein kinase
VWALIVAPSHVCCSIRQQRYLSLSEVLVGLSDHPDRELQSVALASDAASILSVGVHGQVSVCRSLLDIGNGLEYLHALGIVHGDLKPANVLLKSTAADPRGFICKCAGCCLRL